MLDETDAVADFELEEVPAGEQAQPEEAAVEQAEVSETDAGQDSQDDDGPEGDELEDVEWNDKTFKVPKGVGEDIRRLHADYTRKNQENAEFKRELEQKANAIAQQAQLGEEELNLRANYAGLSNELQRYQGVNWDQLSAEDPIEAGNQYRRFQQLRDQAVSVGYRLNQLAAERSEQAKSNETRRLQETHEFAKTKIPGWSPDVDQKVTDFATKELGFDWDTLKSAYTPQVYRALHLAWLGHQAMKKPAASAPNKVPPKPLETVGARSNPSARKSISDMSMEEYAEYRRKGGRG